MKKILSLMILVLGFVSLTNAQDQTVTVNTTHSYNVTDGGLTYTWAVTGGTSTVLSTQTGATASILWDTQGTYTLTVFGKDANNCNSETTTATIKVVGAASVMFADANDNQSIVTCSLLTGDTPNPTAFKVVFTGGVAPYTLNYDVTDQTGATTAQSVVVNTTEQLLSLSDFENTTGSDVIVSIKLTSATTSDGATVTVDTGVGAITSLPNDTRTITVHPKPSISGTITLN